MESIRFPAIPSLSPHPHLLLRHPLPQKRSSSLPFRFSPRPLRVRISCCQLPSAGTSNSDDDGNGNSNMGGCGGGRYGGDASTSGGGRDGGGGRYGGDASTLGGGGGGDGGDGGGDGGDGGGDGAEVGAALSVWAQVGMKLVGSRLAQMEASSRLVSWLPQIPGKRTCVFVDDLFYAMLAIEFGVGIIGETAGEYKKRGENFLKDIDSVLAHVVAQVFTSFMLACVPTISQQLLPRTNARFDGLSHRTLDIISKIALVARFCFFSGRLGKIKGICPKLLADGTSASLRIAPTLFAGRTSVSLVGTGVTEAVTEAREVDIPVVSTPEKVEDNNSWSAYNIDTDFSLGIIADLSSTFGSWFHETLCPAAMWRFSGSWSGYSSGKSGKNGTA